VSWVRLDDGMGEHRKVRRALRAGGLGVFGLHPLAILHASRYLTDGHIEPEFVEETFEHARTRDREQTLVINALERHELWVPADGGGWQIHDYLEHNPSREQVEVKRRADAERKHRGRSSSAQNPTGVQSDSARTPAGIQAESARTPAPPPSDVRVASARPVPSRPVPSRPLHQSSRTTERRVTTRPRTLEQRPAAGAA
jgi:hypothetical protein